MKNIRSKLKLLFNQIEKFGFYIPISNLIIIFYSKYLPKSFVAKLAEKKHKKVEAYLFNLLKDTFVEIEKTKPEVEYIENAPIWWCWLQGEDSLPLVAELCLKSLRKHANGHPVQVITFENYNQYVQLPPFVEEMYNAKKLKAANFTDVLRIALLHKYGGLWVDATLFLTKTIPDEIFTTPFYSIKLKEFGYFVSKCRWTVGFMVTHKNNLLFDSIYKLYVAYLKNGDDQIDYLMLDYFIDMLHRTSNEIQDMIDDVPYNNLNFYSLKNDLCKIFNKEEYNMIIEESFILKLDWRMYKDVDLLSDSNNYYAQMLKKID